MYPDVEVATRYTDLSQRRKREDGVGTRDVRATARAPRRAGVKTSRGETEIAAGVMGDDVKVGVKVSRKGRVGKVGVDAARDRSSGDDERRRIS